MFNSYFNFIRRVREKVEILSRNQIFLSTLLTDPEILHYGNMIQNLVKRNKNDNKIEKKFSIKLFIINMNFANGKNRRIFKIGKFKEK